MSGVLVEFAQRVGPLLAASNRPTLSALAKVLALAQRQTAAPPMAMPMADEKMRKVLATLEQGSRNRAAGQLAEGLWRDPELARGLPACRPLMDLAVTVAERLAMVDLCRFQISLERAA